MVKPNKPSRLSHITDDTYVDEMGEILAKRYRGINVYMAIMLFIAIAIVWTAVLAAKQVQQYHRDYRTLQDIKSEHHKLKVEHQRLLIEQQTFSSTPQIASRAVAELGMYLPSVKDKWILQPTAQSSALTELTLDIEPVVAPDTLATTTQEAQ